MVLFRFQLQQQVMFPIIKITSTKTFYTPDLALHKFNERFWHQRMTATVWSPFVVIGSLVLFLPATLYLKYGKAECQSWNNRADKPNRDLSSTSASVSHGVRFFLKPIQGCPVLSVINSTERVKLTLKIVKNGFLD